MASPTDELSFYRWWKKYKPLKNRRKRYSGWASILHDKDDNQSRNNAYQHYLANPNTIWSIATYEGWIIVGAGWWCVDCIGYVVCRVPYESEVDAPEVRIEPW